MDRERRPLGSVETPDAPPRIVSARCDACGGEGAFGNGRRCGVCAGSGKLEWSPFVLRDELGSVSDPELALIAAIERRREDGDYELLERALADLRLFSVRLHRLWVRRHVFGHGEPLDADAEVDVEAAWRFVEARMPEQVRVPGGVRANERVRRGQLEQIRGRGADTRALGARNQEIRRRYNAGDATVEELVRAFGVSKSTIYEAIHGDDERRTG